MQYSASMSEIFQKTFFDQHLIKELLVSFYWYLIWNLHIATTSTTLVYSLFSPLHWKKNLSVWTIDYIVDQKEFNK